MGGSITTIFSITHPFLDGSFSSSNSTEILMRQFCVQNFITVGGSCEELSCKRPDSRTHWPILECTHFLSKQKRFSPSTNYIYFDRLLKEKFWMWVWVPSLNPHPHPRRSKSLNFSGDFAFFAASGSMNWLIIGQYNEKGELSVLPMKLKFGEHWIKLKLHLSRCRFIDSQGNLRFPIIKRYLQSVGTSCPP
jgi:hypothetical protein